ncbi:hypothetical protein [Pontibacter liquoris]|uniref:hypothetical protein n=1 Tax=Pontibacter liquoris TaxID=2905677 RepID=UPI001FA7CD66|nr:hypothetical protein [Pontibacter liquoris]
MQKLILLICSTFILAQTHAQVREHSFFVTASGGATIQKEDASNKSQALLLSTSINYRLNNSWSIGLVAEHTRTTAQSAQTLLPVNGGSGYSGFYSASELKRRSWFLGPQARYYWSVNDRLSAFGEAQAGLYFESAEVESNSQLYYYHSPDSPYNLENGTPAATSYSTSKTSAVSVRAVASPGIIYFIKPRLGLELKTSILQYDHGLENSRFPEGQEQSQGFTVDLSLANSRLGVNFYF